MNKLIIEFDHEHLHRSARKPILKQDACIHMCIGIHDIFKLIKLLGGLTMLTPSGGWGNNTDFKLWAEFNNVYVWCWNS